MNILKLFFLFFIMLCILPKYLHADLVTIEAKVQVNDVWDYGGYFQNTISKGDYFSVIYSYDTQTIPDEHLLHNEYEQVFPCSIDINLGNASFKNDLINGYVIDIQNVFDPYGGQDMYIIDAGGRIIFDSGSYIDNVNIDFLLIDYLHDAISNKDLHIPNLTIWDDAKFSISSENNFTVGGSIVEIIQIPEPSAILIFSIAMPFFRKQ